jgi:hypothetical protein
MAVCFISAGWEGTERLTWAAFYHFGRQGDVRKRDEQVRFSAAKKYKISMKKHGKLWLDIHQTRAAFEPQESSHSLPSSPLLRIRFAHIITSPYISAHLHSTILLFPLSTFVVIQPEIHCIDTQRREHAKYYTVFIFTHFCIARWCFPERFDIISTTCFYSFVSATTTLLSRTLPHSLATNSPFTGHAADHCRPSDLRGSVPSHFPIIHQQTRA